jgi:hypothetical protein
VGGRAQGEVRKEDGRALMAVRVEDETVNGGDGRAQEEGRGIEVGGRDQRE